MFVCQRLLASFIGCLTLMDAEHAARLAGNGRNQRHVNGAGTDGKDIHCDPADGRHVCQPVTVPACYTYIC